MNDRFYPVLAINAPTTTGTKVVLPGDPVSLYAALAVLVARCVEARCALSGAGERSIPDFGVYPDRLGRRGDERMPMTPQVPDDCIFDPRIWNEKVEAKLRMILENRQPRIVMISNTSLGHPYAVIIARVVRELVPDAIIVLGGAHEDDTMRCVQSEGQFLLSKASTLRSMMDGRVDDLFDFVASGDAEYALDFLCSAISDVMREWRDMSDRRRVLALVRERRAELIRLPGFFSLGFIDEYGDLTTYVSEGKSLDYESLPPIYRLFAIRSRFDVFTDDAGKPRRTAHIITTRACPNTCIYCSEGRGLQKNGLRAVSRCAADRSAKRLVEMVKEYISYGAQAAFFDDSILFGGNKARIIAFCKAFHQACEHARERISRGDAGEDERRRMIDLMRFEWGGQLCVEDLVGVSGDETERGEEVLAWLKSAGCTYIYIGVESLDEEVMRNIDKHRYRAGAQVEYRGWRCKVDRALIMCKEAGIRVGVSAQFGLPGEDDRSIDITISGLATLIREGKISLISPNVSTYHPGTSLTYLHRKTDLDFLSIPHMKKPYSLFEEAIPQYTSVLLTEEQLWHISKRVYEEWNTINIRETA